MKIDKPIYSFVYYNILWWSKSVSEGETQPNYREAYDLKYCHKFIILSIFAQKYLRMWGSSQFRGRSAVLRISYKTFKIFLITSCTLTKLTLSEYDTMKSYHYV